MNGHHASIMPNTSNRSAFGCAVTLNPFSLFSGEYSIPAYFERTSVVSEVRIMLLPLVDFTGNMINAPRDLKDRFLIFIHMLSGWQSHNGRYCHLQWASTFCENAVTELA